MAGADSSIDSTPARRGRGHEKELRIALVCYGGLSLAVYMHGITKELLKLVSASSALHDADGDSSHANLAANDGRERDTELVYFDLLQSLRPQVDLRVVIDAIAGTSAGGINGIMLARALAHDLPLDTHRSMWLEGADIDRLMEPRAMAGHLAKPFMRPLLWGLLRDPQDLDDEARRKVSQFARSTWFRPPFSGSRFTHMLLDGLRAMGSSTGSRSLLPRGHTLSLFVTLTNYQGFVRPMRIYSPTVVHEREHRHLLEFRYRMRHSGELTSHFLDDNAPALAFAARGTSSYGGLFPPLGVGEIDAALEARGERWPGRTRFLARQFGSLSERGESPESHVFIDGGVLDNKPFEAAIRAIRGRPAQREVDRRLLYVEPRPESLDAPAAAAPRSFFSVVRRSFADLPRAEPIRDSLAALETTNEQARVLRRILAHAWPKVRASVAEAMAAETARGQDVGHFRRLCEAGARENSGYAFDSYVLLRLDDLARRVLAASPQAGASVAGVLAAASAAFGNGEEGDAPLVATRALDALDVDYRIRRLRFVIARVNEMYADREHVESAEGDALLDRLKEGLYTLIGRLQDARVSAARSVPFDLETGPRRLAKVLDLAHHDHAADALFSTLGEGADELLVAYAGFAYIDVSSYGAARWSDVEEMQEVKVMRLSAEDATSLRAGGAGATLKGIKLFNFGGFFSRAYRENDYLWGRLHSAERIVDLISDAAGDGASLADADLMRVKCRLFEAILDAEAPHLGAIRDEMQRVRAEVAKLATSA